MKVRCPKCKHEFEALEHPAPILKVPNIKEERMIKTQALFMNHTPSVKRGFTELVETISEKNGATWTDLERKAKSKHISTATMAKRLREGKKVGAIKEELRSGRKVYRLR